MWPLLVLMHFTSRLTGSPSPAFTFTVNHTGLPISFVVNVRVVRVSIASTGPSPTWSRPTSVESETERTERLTRRTWRPDDYQGRVVYQERRFTSEGVRA